jgi:hypothetical protein
MKHCQWLFLFGLLAASQAHAQVMLKATLEEAHSVLRLTIEQTMSSPSGVAGYDIYRHDAWLEDPGTLVTHAVLPLQRGSYEVVDSGIQNDHLYVYELRAVDATRRPLNVDWVDYLSVGRALVAEAKVVQGACDLYLESCPTSNFKDAWVVQGAVGSLVGNGQYYRMYGHIAGPPTPMSSGTTTFVDEVVSMECASTVAVETSTWGHVKTLFR